MNFTPGQQKAPPPFTNTESAMGWTRVLHFADQRPPQLVQFDLERELMVLFIASLDQGQLRLNATAHVNGARYDFEVRFLAALPSANHFSLYTEVSWAEAAPTHHEYFRQSSDGWYRLWTRGLAAATPPAAGDVLPDRYQQLCQAALRAEAHLDSVAAVQGAIVGGLKRGGSYGTSHKEGGSNIYWRVDHFVRSDYGEYPDLKTFQTDAEFLKMLWNFCQFEVTRHAGKQGLPELDAWKLILRRLHPAV